jgi:hypothetical protein
MNKELSKQKEEILRIQNKYKENQIIITKESKENVEAIVLKPPTSKIIIFLNIKNY